MNILIIGGKRFVGYHIALQALQQGHTVTFFNRGRTNRELFPECENIIGDRNTDIHLIKDRAFDYVIDTCAYFPSQVRYALEALKGNFRKYLLISTLSVVNPNEEYFDESVDLFKADYTSTKITGETYGPLKVACEEILLEEAKEKAIIIRPGYIVGNRDYTYRFSYYAIMMHYLDEVLLPTTNNLNYSFVDGEDLAKFVIHSLVSDLSGVYHTVGPKGLTFEAFLERTKKVVNPTCNIIKADDKFLEDNNIVKPLAFPTCNDDQFGNYIFTANCDKAINAGFITKPIEESIQAGLDYYLEMNESLDDLKVGMNNKTMQEYIQKIQNK